MDQNTAGVVAGTSGLAALLTIFQDVSAALFGVPLPVVLAAMTGAWFARSLAPAAGFFSALGATAGWTVAGCVLAPVVQFAVKYFTKTELPNAAFAGVALIVSGGLPMILPVVRTKLPEIVGSWLDRLKGTPK